MQTLSHYQNLIHYFAIEPNPDETDNPMHSLDSLDDMTLLDDLQEAMFSTDDAGVVELDSDAVLEFFRSSGAEDHIKDLSAPEVVPLIGSPLENEPKLVKLHWEQNLCFEMHSKSVLRGSTAL